MTDVMSRAAGRHRPLLVLSVAAAVLAVVTAVGVVVDGRVLTGVPIWLKPFKFSVSFVLYAATLAWMLAQLPRRSRVAEWSASVVVAMAVVEMAVIVGQVLRGTTSHYNETRTGYAWRCSPGVADRNAPARLSCPDAGASPAGARMGGRVTVRESDSVAYQVAVRAVAQETGTGRIAALRGLGELVAGRPGLRPPAVAALADHLRTPVGADGWDADARREAGRVLATLLRPAAAAEAAAGSADPTADPEPPPAVDLDLRAATLVDLDLGGVVLGAGRFADARFLGATSFVDARFTGVADFARTVCHGPARFTRARFLGHAAFGRARFRADADFTGARFAAFAWFGRGEDELWEDDPAWETIEETSPAPWDEPNEDDPHWPVAVVMGDYQEWSEGGDGARFVGPVSFRQARFAGPAWFFKARFGADATFRQARFGGPVHLDQPTVDLAGATWAGTADDGPVCWPLGWTPAPAPAVPDGVELVPDDSVRPYAGQLADADPDVRRAGLAVLADLGDARPELRQRVVDTVCGYLRMPLSFDLADARTGGQAAELELRHTAQRLLAARLRPSTDAPGGPPHWAGTDLMLCGATLVDLDLGGCHVGHADFTGVQFHGDTRFAGSVFTGATFRLAGGDGRASFHGPVSFAGARLDRRRSVRESLGEVVCHAGVVIDGAVSPPG